MTIPTVIPISNTSISEGFRMGNQKIDQIILVTGSTDGIGKATALELARRGYRVVLHGRDEKKGRSVQEEIGGKTGNDRLGLIIADFSRREDVREMAAGIRDDYDRLDVLINNAGVYMPERRLTPDGLETTFQVNFLAPFLLTHLLLPILTSSAPARIVTVASIAHRSVNRVEWDNLQGERKYDPYYAYCLSKLGNIIFTYELARRLEGTQVTANCLHPGVTDTKLLRAGWSGIGGAPPEEGAKTSVCLATSHEVERVSGRYFEEMRPAVSSSVSRDPRVQERLWRIGETFAGL